MIRLLAEVGGKGTTFCSDSHSVQKRLVMNDLYYYKKEIGSIKVLRSGLCSSNKRTEIRRY